MPATQPMRELTVIAQDPSVQDSHHRPILNTLRIPCEPLAPGPEGYRVHVVDYDASRGRMYKPADLGDDGDRFRQETGKCWDAFLHNPAFHAQNVYAIVMSLLGRFEFALGRRVSWGFGGHQLFVAPHAFYEPNAYYSEDARGLLFGYFNSTGQPDKDDDETIYACLSHDIIAHETTHALVDGLRDSYTLPSGADQAGFHEGFADTVAILSVMSQEDLVRAILGGAEGANADTIATADLQVDKIANTALAGFADEFGKELRGFSEGAIRNALKTVADDSLQFEAYEECHLRGEVLTAAMMRALMAVWRKRLDSWIGKDDTRVALDRVSEDLADAAGHLLTMAIRALDYCPVVNIAFEDFLSALLTADREVLPDDGKYKYREQLLETFARYRITMEPTDARGNLRRDDGCWMPFDDGASLSYDCVHRQSLERDRDEVFRFLWLNRKALGVREDAYTRVTSVRPCVRVSPDGFVVRETVCEYMQTDNLEARELWNRFRVRRPKGMAMDASVRLHGGGVLIFDEFGHLKYHIASKLGCSEGETFRLEYLHRNRIHDTRGSRNRYGYGDGTPRGQRFAVMHQRRQNRLPERSEWDD